MKKEWGGPRYELLTNNCNHFCEALAKELQCKPTPAWLNRMASGADATISFTNNAVQVQVLIILTYMSYHYQSNSKLQKDNYFVYPFKFSSQRMSETTSPMRRGG